ncbi:MAG: peptidoglycan DD-metalloendopeptidase family protein [Alistipes sp.]|nr:peptidoglycan DD-metalloendopeptidase family protein [Alistipes sp.]
MRRIMPNLYRGLVWAAMIIGWYVVFTLAIDMPAEYKLRHSVDDMRTEYEKLEKRYKNLSLVLDNVEERDKNVFRKLFQSDPYDLNAKDENTRSELNAQLMEMSNANLQDILTSRVRSVNQQVERLMNSYEEFGDAVVHDHMTISCIPSIQPVNNSRLTLLASGKKPLINPFHRSMTEHHGVDYLVPEGTAVFATADGRIENLSEKNSTNGKSITIDHGNGYKTTYSHLLDIRVSEGERVKRGDIIALSGNSGLSFAPHLHYEVSLYGTRVDPVHYFFMELSAEDYQRIIRIALSSMQSFD